MAFPNSIAVKVIDQKSSEYKAVSAPWTSMELLNEGGHRLRQNAAQFLTRKAKEPTEIYQARLLAFTYENILGPVLDWYRARMANCHSEISLESNGAALAGADGEWYANFLKSCERTSSKKNVALVSFLADRFKDVLLYGRGYTLIDKPKPDMDPSTRLDQRRMGLLDPYLVAVDPPSIIDWATSQNGELDYAVMRCEDEIREFGQASRSVRRWYVYTRTEFAEYSADVDESGKEVGNDATLIDQGPHALTEANRVPILPWYAQKGQWLADRALLSLLAHVDLLNGDRWSMFNALLPMLVITGQFDGDAVRSEIAFLNIPDGDAKYLSPDAAVFSVAKEKLLSLKEESYRQMHVQAQARTSHATPAAQSGISKQQDMTAATEVLDGFGVDMRDYATSVMETVILARGDKDIKPVVAGWQFDEPATADTLDAAERTEALEIGSETFEKEMRKRVVRVAIPDLPAGTLQVIDKEIDAAESSQDRKEREAMAGATRMAASGKKPSAQADAEDDGGDLEGF